MDTITKTNLKEAISLIKFWEEKYQELLEKNQKLQDENSRLERKAILSESKAKVYHEQLLHLADSAHKMVLAQKAVSESLE